MQWDDAVRIIMAAAVFSLGIIAAGHALLYKRHPSSALGWIVVTLALPLAGPILYLLFGVNRIRTRGKKLAHRWQIGMRGYEQTDGSAPPLITTLSLPEEFVNIARISSGVTRRGLVAGNRVQMLHNGEEAYPEMLKAIEAAERTVFLCTYIFETNKSGRRFIDGLTRALNRGVDVRVILDGVGELYSFPRAGTLLEKSGIPTGRFLPPSLFPPSASINLRNHRKMLTVDGTIVFTGGMNIGDRHLAQETQNPNRVVDLHFRVQGPVARQVEQVFLEDWGFIKEEEPSPINVYPEAEGEAVCRSIVDGPNEDLDKLSIIMVGAAAVARKRISIMTPYFLPSRELISALQAAAVRGVNVTVILPARNNLPFVHWATRNMLWELLKWGVEVYYQPGPFVHSKLFMVDDYYAHIGSANVDVRSLRLNFELAVEIYDRRVVAEITDHFDRCLQKSRQTTLEEIDSRPLAARIRDAGAWLFSAYL